MKVSRGQQTPQTKTGKTMELFNKNGVVIDQGTKDLENMMYKMTAQHVEHLIREGASVGELMAFSTYLTNSVARAVSTNMLDYILTKLFIQ